MTQTSGSAWAETLRAVDGISSDSNSKASGTPGQQEEQKPGETNKVAEIFEIILGYVVISIVSMIVLVLLGE